VVFISLRLWQSMGAGNWSGWCLPWASILCARCNLADAAVAWLHWWHDLFTNVGQGTLHDADFGGAGGLHRGSELETAPPAANHEIMQMDAAMGAVTAIMELLVQDRADTLHVLPALPRRWRELSFDGIRTPGAFLVGATVRAAGVTEIRVTSLAGEPLRLAHGLGPRWRLNGQPRRGPVLQTKTRRGQQLRLTCQPR
jgi:hypothetical protein